MEHFDVIVCGAGPSGSSSAKTLAENGLKVLLLEKEKLPRRKTCGGGMPIAITEFLKNVEPSAFVESEVTYMRHTLNYKDPILVPINQDSSTKTIKLFMVQRSIFDNAIAVSACKAGAILKDDLALTLLEIENGKVKIKAKSKNDTSYEASADYIIGADGANGQVAKFVGLRKEKIMAFALEIEHPYEWKENSEFLRKDVLHLEYGVPGGYAWIFPKKDHLNVGAGIFSPFTKEIANIKNPKELLQDSILKYLEMFKISYNKESMHFYGHPLPIWNGKQNLHTKDEKVILVGDSAGLINPLFGDGILHAVKSGIIAGECIINKDVKNYTRIIHEEFGINFDSARRLAPIFCKFVNPVYNHVVKRPTATRVAAELLSGDLTFTSVADRTIQRLSTLIPGLNYLVKS